MVAAALTMFSKDGMTSFQSLVGNNLGMRLGHRCGEAEGVHSPLQACTTNREHTWMTLQPAFSRSATSSRMARASWKAWAWRVMSFLGKDQFRMIPGATEHVNKDTTKDRNRYLMANSKLKKGLTNIGQASLDLVILQGWGILGSLHNLMQLLSGKGQASSNAGLHILLQLFVVRQSLNAKINSNYKFNSKYRTYTAMQAAEHKRVPSCAKKQPEQQGQRHQTRQSVHQQHQRPTSSHWGSHASQPGPESWRPLLILAHPRSPKRWLALAACKLKAYLGNDCHVGIEE
ncbi:MAG: hypothetical protein FRX49_07203 [Trebouxia sp. A1-2]|nr:MAG: hypothetical protein FRX49_07203 [Trebouxia sp. A1-2]